MKLLDRLERRYGRYAIENLIMIICAGQALVFMADIVTDYFVSDLMQLSWSMVMHGQVWRLITFVFVPDSDTLLSMVISLYFYYMIGGALENEWGSFQFDCFYVIAMLCQIIASIFSGYGFGSLINQSLFFAFALLYPNYQVLLFYFIPIKVKWIALLDALLYVYELVVYPGMRLNILLSLVPLIIFFGQDTVRRIRLYINRRRNRQNYDYRYFR